MAAGARVSYPCDCLFSHDQISGYTFNLILRYRTGSPGRPSADPRAGLPGTDARGRDTGVQHLPHMAQLADFMRSQVHAANLAVAVHA